MGKQLLPQFFSVLFLFSTTYLDQMSREQWDTRYQEREYVYGTEPNQFLRSELAILPSGKILFPAEGEGRNAVFAASRGWDADAFDQSIKGRDKALKLAAEKGVSINYWISSIEEWLSSVETYDCIALIFMHLPPDIRSLAHQKACTSLKPGGIIILEGFTKEQMPRTSGGPKNLDLLFDADVLRADFNGLEFLTFARQQTILDEGPLHQGLADVIRIVAKKPFA